MPDPGTDITFFKILARDEKTRARLGVLKTPHGQIQTPVFMPVGTAGSVKAVTHEVLEALDSRIILANTYHLYLRPGEEVIRSQGGLHRFIAWNRPILTDSGGYQVFSHSALRSITEEGVQFRSHLDGSQHFFSPETSIHLQQAFGSDILMAFDDCTPYPVSKSEAAESMRRSMRWAKRCTEVHREGAGKLFGIVQGSVFPDLRAESVETLCDLELDGVALGGLSVGEPKELMYEVIEQVQGLMPEQKPRYLMGAGTPGDLLFAVSQGMDMFDCVLPTRNARNGMLFTSAGPVRIKNARYRSDEGPLDPQCGCPVCGRYSRSYLRHLFVSGEMVSGILNSCHNLYFYLDLMSQIRESIALDSFSSFKERIQAQYSNED